MLALPLAGKGTKELPRTGNFESRMCPSDDRDSLLAVAGGHVAKLVAVVVAEFSSIESRARLRRVGGGLTTPG